MEDIPMFSIEGKFDAKVVDVYDGDTCTILLFNDNKVEKFKVRCLGYDSPEMKPSKSINNRNVVIFKAIEARNYFINRVTNHNLLLNMQYSKEELKDIFNTNSKLIQVECHGWDKYGRLLCKFFDKNININEDMVSNGYGYVYDGGTKQVVEF